MSQTEEAANICGALIVGLQEIDVLTKRKLILSHIFPLYEQCIHSPQNNRKAVENISSLFLQGDILQIYQKINSQHLRCRAEIIM